MRERKPIPCRAAIRLCIALAIWTWGATGASADPTVTNPEDATYDPQTGMYFGPDGAPIPTPPVPPFLSNRGWGRDPATGQLIDPNGARVDPSRFYPSPETNPNPDGTTYDPTTKTYVGPSGARPYVDLPPYLDARGYRSDPATSEILDPDGNPVDPATLFPPPERERGLTYDPKTKKYYNAAGTESPPTPTPAMTAQGWQYNPTTGQWVDASGKAFAPELVLDAPSDPNPNGLSYDPQTGKYFDPDGNLVPGELPQFMTNQGYKLDPATGDITDPNGRRVSPADLFPRPDANPAGVSYDAGSQRFYSGSGGTVAIPDLPGYMKERGWQMNFRTGKLIDPEGMSHDPSTYFPAPSTDTGLLYDPDTDKFYTPGGIEAPPTLPRTMQDMGWQWNGATRKFVDPNGRVVDPGTLCPHPHPEPLPGGNPSRPTTPTTTNTPTSLDLPDLDLGTETVGVTNTFGELDFWYNTPPAPAGTAQPNVHVVEPGENLFRIALRYGTTLSELAALNGITDSASLYVGQRLTIPASSDAAMPSDRPLDIGSLNSAAAAAGRREPQVQLEIVFVSRTPAPGLGTRREFPRGAGNAPWRDAPVPTVAALFAPAEAWLRPTVRIHAASTRYAPPPAPVLEAAPGAAPQSPDTGPQVLALFTSLGVSSGAAFEVELLSSAAPSVDIGATGVVLEPLDERGQREAREAFAQAARGRATTKVGATGYCLELMREPPPAGMVFRVASPELQEAYTPMRDIWRAAKQLMSAGGLSPDSDPEQYFHSIVQWSLWSKENGFDLESFRDNFMDRTKKNFAAAGQAWTGPVEQAVRQIVPNRWNDIQSVLRDAERSRSDAAN